MKNEVPRGFQCIWRSRQSAARTACALVCPGRMNLHRTLPDAASRQQANVQIVSRPYAKTYDSGARGCVAIDSSSLWTPAHMHSMTAMGSVHPVPLRLSFRFVRCCLARGYARGRWLHHFHHSRRRVPGRAPEDPCLTLEATPCPHSRRPDRRIPHVAIQAGRTTPTRLCAS